MPLEVETPALTPAHVSSTTANQYGQRVRVAVLQFSRLYLSPAASAPPTPSPRTGHRTSGRSWCRLLCGEGVHLMQSRRHRDSQAYSETCCEELVSGCGLLWDDPVSKEA